jgi:hypothetical protein
MFRKLPIFMNRGLASHSGAAQANHGRWSSSRERLPTACLPHVAYRGRGRSSSLDDRPLSFRSSAARIRTCRRAGRAARSSCRRAARRP